LATALSILDLAPVNSGQSVGEAIAASVALAQTAEASGYRRVWYAEHHNMSAIGSSATSVLIAHVAAHTKTIRLGSGGIMLPNHSPLVIAEQFGTLASIHPGRIELGLGRAPGSDQATWRAMRRDPAASDRFPQDVLELQAFLGSESRIPGVEAFPGKNTNVPLYILGSSTFGAQLAAALGLPFAFASHFSPGSLRDAVAIYRRDFKSSDQLSEPHVIAGVNVIVADTPEAAEEGHRRMKVNRIKRMYARGGRPLTDDEVEQLLASGAAQQIEQMIQYTAVGTPAVVKDYLDGFQKHADADELIVAHQFGRTEARLRSVELLAQAMAPADA
jgi:luciferase family oxidoreductase group 1